MFPANGSSRLNRPFAGSYHLALGTLHEHSESHDACCSGELLEMRRETPGELQAMEGYRGAKRFRPPARWRALTVCQRTGSIVAGESGGRKKGGPEERRRSVDGPSSTDRLTAILSPDHPGGHWVACRCQSVSLDSLGLSGRAGWVLSWTCCRRVMLTWV